MMHFSLTNVPASFQEYMNKIFAKKLNIFVIVYLDEILIYINNNGDGHVIAIWWVLEQVRKFLLHTNLKKYQFYRKALVL